jgi:hypothetical protein
MTLLRRAPREVYRVYAEDEFFAGPGLDERWEADACGPESRRLHRAAGATMLLAAVGALGGLITVTSLSSTARARRQVGSGPLAATASLGSSAAASAHVWREPARVEADRHRGARARGIPVRARPRTGISTRAASIPRSRTAHERDRTVPVEAPTTVSSVRMVADASPASSAPAPPTQSPTPSPVPAEFGFER